ncbi:nose resistant to fluoxetine protein 6-like isoform X2 [Varroa jacobsoni]|uniref:nose resistant to fluoxetine protein 6-like isoform X2 n=1 Tax=Varroa jacobsoni TaxID=62625 RepID=UPI000BF3AE51|nr:nose resistant to fluoxetine protein 6-like isoform X2 [Varroa jacobsoni]
MRWFISLAGTFVLWMGLISGLQAMDANIEALQHKVALIHKILKNHVPNPMDKSDDELHEEITANIAELWAKYDAALQIHVDHLLRQFLPYVLEVANTDLQVDCIRSLLRVVRGLKTLDTWAFQLLDSIGRPAAGIMDVTMSDYGDYDQCLAVTSYEADGPIDFRGQHCNIAIRPPAFPPLSTNSAHKLQEVLNGTSVYKEVLLTYYKVHQEFELRMGVCAPSKCSATDVFRMLQPLADSLGVRIDVLGCESLDTPLQLDTQQFCVVCCLTLSVFLVAMGTTIQGLPKSLRGQCPKGAIMAFDLKQNLRLLLSTSSTGPCALRCLHGLRVMSLLWVVLCQTYRYLDFRSMRNLAFLIGAMNSMPFQLVANGFLAVENFFFISGLLMSYRITATSSDNVIRYKDIFTSYLHRLTSCALFSVGIFSVLPLVGSGPVWRENVLNATVNCHANWLPILFSVNNFVSADKMCTPNLWFLSADWQLQVVLLVLVVLLVKKPAMGALVAFAVIVVTSSLVGAHTVLANYPATILPLENPRVMALMMDDIFMQAHTHAAPFTVGICTGYLIGASPFMRLRPVTRLMLWPVSLVLMVLALLIPWLWNRGNGSQSTDLVKFLYAAGHRSMWALGLMWIVVCCASGNAPILDRLLGWPALRPLSRLSLSAYLLSPVIIYYQQWTIRERLYGRHFTVLNLFIVNMIYLVFASAIFYLFVEQPLRQFSKSTFESMFDSNAARGSLEDGGPVRFNDSISHQEPLEVQSKPGKIIKVYL